MRRICVLMTALALLAMGCIPLSVHPLYTENDLVFDPTLVGAWGDPAEPEDGMWIFRQAGPKSYRLITCEDIGDTRFWKLNDEELEEFIDSHPGKVGVFQAHLTQLGEQVFLDVFPDEPPVASEFYLSHIVPAHSFYRITLEGDRLGIDLLDLQWLNKSIDSGTVTLPHERRKDVYVLTAPTEQLQQFVREHMEDAFESDGERLHRIE